MTGQHYLSGGAPAPPGHRLLSAVPAPDPTLSQAPLHWGKAAGGAEVIPGCGGAGGPGQEKRSLSHSVEKGLRQMGRQTDIHREELVLALGP